MSASSLTCEIIENARDWSALEHDWRQLFASSPSAASTLSWEWLNKWWLIFGATYGCPPGGMKVITIRNGASLIAALPLYLRQPGTSFSRKRLGLLGTGEALQEAVYPEKLDVLHAPVQGSEREILLTALVEALSAIDWHEWDSGVIAEDSLLFEILQKLPQASARSIRREYPAPFADLSGGFEAYLERQSSNSRQQFRRMLRAVPNAKLTFEIAQSAETAQNFFQELVALHQKRWNESGQLGAFHSERVRNFHTALIAELSARGEVILARLGNNDGPVAVLYGFVVGQGFDFYQSGLTRDGVGELKSPGIAAHLLLMQYLAGKGISTYDFLAGASSYKDKLATGSRTFVRIRLLKLTLGNVVHMVQEIGTRLTKHFTRSATSADREVKHA